MNNDGDPTAQSSPTRSTANKASLALAVLHVREAEALIVRQEKVVAEMDRDNHPVALAEAQALLVVLHDSLRFLRETLDQQQQKTCS